ANKSSEIYVAQITGLPGSEGYLSTGISADHLIRFTLVRVRGIPEARLTVNPHTLRNTEEYEINMLLKHRVVSFSRRLSDLPELAIHFHRNVSGPVLGRILFAPKERADLRISPMHHCHSSRPANTTGDNTLGNSVVNRHSGHAINRMTHAIIEDFTDLDQHCCKRGRTGSRTAERLEACACGPDVGHVEHPVIVLGVRSVVSVQQLG